MKLMKYIDAKLNSITMYRLVLYSLCVLVCIALIFSFFGIISYSPLSLIVSLIVLFVSCGLVNIICAAVLKVPRNAESVYISALLLFFVLAPAANLGEVGIIALAGALAMLSKYVFAIRRKHIFNPVAIAAVFIGIFGSGQALWWVGSIVLMPFVLIAGLLIVRKIRRYALTLSFLIASLISISVFGLINQQNILVLLLDVFASWPLIFFGTFMLTEPLTTPPIRKTQIIYGIIVGVLFGAQFHIGPLYSTPEFALVVGNIFSFWVSPGYKLRLRLKERNKIASDIYELSFESDQKLDFKPGQYLEWTIPADGADSRGNRRYFTIASSPTENLVKIAIRIALDPAGGMSTSSSFKSNLLSMNIGTDIFATSLAGDFSLPQDMQQKFVFIAGGIGITPFRSMAQQMIDSGIQRNILMFYAATSVDRFVYKDIFDKAMANGLRTEYILSGATSIPAGWTGHSGFITADLIKQHLPDIGDTAPATDMTHHLFYLSGPNAMVTGYKNMLLSLGVHNSNIHTDYFPGF